MDTSGLSYLTALTRLQHLDMAANENVDTADVAMLTTLKVLTLEACELLDGNIEELSPLTGLTALSLSMNFHLSDLQNLQVRMPHNYPFLQLFRLVILRGFNDGRGDGD